MIALFVSEQFKLLCSLSFVSQNNTHTHLHGVLGPSHTNTHIYYQALNSVFALNDCESQ